jgi:sn-glycerol 3-phosphate transport system permease protein
MEQVERLARANGRAAIRSKQTPSTPIRLIGSLPRLLISILIILVFFIPFYWMILTSIKSLGETLLFPPTLWVKAPQWQNFATAFAAVPFLKYIGNSLVVAVGILSLQLLTVIPAAYAFARYRFRGDRFFFGITMATMMIPAQLVFLPVFLMMSDWNLINRFPSLILPSAASAFGIFMLRQTFRQVPEELVEAARLDKAGEWKIIYRVMLPIARPTVITLALLTFISTWNDYFWPLVLTTNDNVRTLPVGIVSLRMVEGGVSYHTVMAGNVMLLIPIAVAFFLAQRQIIQAFTYMGEK